MAYTNSSKTYRSSDFRPFECNACEHKLRFGASRCGRCYEPTGLMNRKWTWVGIALMIVLVPVLLAIVALL